jgi:NAD-dependent SIR2 family protein deacetylase
MANKPERSKFMSNKQMSVGDPLESRCTKCRKITNHLIVAMTDGKPAKVECNTCKGQHKYRHPVVRKKAAPRRSVDPKLAEREEWEKLRPSLENKQAIVYSMTTAFKVGSVMKHPVFGLGVVLNSLGLGKVEVLFEAGKKKMRCL